MTEATRAHGGRPPAGPFRDRRGPLTTRLTDETRAALEAASQASGRSLGQEAEYRLAASFAEDKERQDAFGGPELDALFKMMAGVAEILQRQMGRPWFSDWATHRATRSGWDAILDSSAPASPLLDMLPVDPWPERPQLPVYPERRGGLLTPPNEVTDADYAAAMARYRQEMESYAAKCAEVDAEIARRRAALQATQDYIADLDKLGKRAASAVSRNRPVPAQPPQAIKPSEVPGDLIDALARSAEMSASTRHTVEDVKEMATPHQAIELVSELRAAAAGHRNMAGSLEAVARDIERALISGMRGEDAA